MRCLKTNGVPFSLDLKAPLAGSHENPWGFPMKIAAETVIGGLGEMQEKAGHRNERDEWKFKAIKNRLDKRA